MNISENWHLYVIRTIDKKLYTGITTDVERRVREHFSLGGKTARYLRAHHPDSLAFCKLIGDKSLAYKVEYHFKRLKKSVKEDIIKRNRLMFDSDTGNINRV